MTSPTLETVKRPVADFSEDQYGLRLGGPILSDSLFFFVSGENNAKEAPNGTSADGSTATRYQGGTSPAAVASILRTRYGYDPGGLGDIVGATDSDLAFARLDWNAASGHQVTLRHNYLKANRDIIENRGTHLVPLPDLDLHLRRRDQLDGAAGQQRLRQPLQRGRASAYQTIRDMRAVPVTFPSVEVGPHRAARRRGARRHRAVLGRQRPRPGRPRDHRRRDAAARQPHHHGRARTTRSSSSATPSSPTPSATTTSPTLAAFDAGSRHPVRHHLRQHRGSAAAGFEVRQYGLYAGDQWRVNDRLTLTFGLRGDKPQLPRQARLQPGGAERPRLRHLGDAERRHRASRRASASTGARAATTSCAAASASSPAARRTCGSPTPSTAPASFSTSLTSNCPGGTPFTAHAVHPLQPRPRHPAAHRRRRLGSIAVDLIDPDFDFPRVLRATLGYDRELPWGIRATVEGVWSQTQKDVFYKNVGKVRSGSSPLDGRPRFANRNSTVTNAYLLTNTSKGEEKVLTLQLQRTFSHGFQANASYTWMDAESAHDATSSRAVSNWQFRPTKGDIFERRRRALAVRGRAPLHRGADLHLQHRPGGAHPRPVLERAVGAAVLAA